MSSSGLGAGVGSGTVGGSRAPAFGIDADRTAPPVRARQAVAVLALVVLAAAGIGWCVLTGLPSSSARPEVFGGSIVLPHAGHDPVVADLATGHATVRLQNLKGSVSATDIDQVAVVPTDIGTFLVNRQTGTYNLLDKDNVVVLRSGGIELPAGADPAATVQAYPASGGLYLVRRSPARTEVYLVDRDTVLQGNAGPNVKARAAAVLGGASSARAGGAVVAGDVLWLVAPIDGDAAQLTRLRPPADPDEHDFAVDRVAAIDAVAVLAVGHDGTVAASAQGVGRVVVVGRGTEAPREVALSAAKESRGIVAATTDGDGAWFTYRGDDGGWALVQVRPDGTAAEAVGIGDSRTIEHLRPPAILDGRAWLVGGDDGSVRRLDLARRETVRPAGADKYPTIEGDNPGEGFFADAELIVRGPRLVVNAPRALRALIIDGTSEEVSVVNKSQALDFDASAPPNPQIKAGEGGQAPTDPGGQAPPSTQPAAVKDPVTDEHACENLSQTPRKPRLRALDPTDKTLTASWDYTKLDPGDCQPSSYLIEVHGVNGTEDPANPVRTHTTAETRFTITGLRPNRTYEVRVTAVIGNNRTTSEPLQRKTDDAGPDPARSVATDAQNPGGWRVTWAACQANECDVAAVQWEVSWALCGSGGFIGGQAPITGLAAGAREVRLDLATHPELVGKSLTFTVTAISAAGQRAATPDNACNEGWNKPNGQQVKLTADAREENGSVTVTASVEQTPEPKVAIFGGANPQFTFSSGNVSVGPTSSRTADLRGLQLGVQHEIKATVTVHGQVSPAASVIVPAVFKGWPPMTADFAITPRTGTNTADLLVTVHGAPSDVSILAQADVNCQGTYVPSPPKRLEGGKLTWSADLVSQLGPSCTGNVKLSQPDNPVYATSIDLDLPAVTIPKLTPPKVTATWEVVGTPPFAGIRVVFTGTIPTNGADWELVPTRTQGFCHNPIQLGPGEIPSWVRMESDCVNDQNEIVLQWQYLKTVEQVTITTSNARPNPDPPSSTTTTTTAPATTTTTKAGPTTTKTPTTKAGFVDDGGGDPLRAVVGALGVLVLAHAVRRRRVDLDPASRPPDRRRR